MFDANVNRDARTAVTQGNGFRCCWVGKLSLVTTICGLGCYWPHQYERPLHPSTGRNLQTCRCHASRLETAQRSCRAVGDAQFQALPIVLAGLPTHDGVAARAPGIINPLRPSADKIGRLRTVSWRRKHDQARKATV